MKQIEKGNFKPNQEIEDYIDNMTAEQLTESFNHILKPMAVISVSVQAMMTEKDKRFQLVRGEDSIPLNTTANLYWINNCASHIGEGDEWESAAKKLDTFHWNKEVYTWRYVDRTFSGATVEELKELIETNWNGVAKYYNSEDSIPNVMIAQVTIIMPNSEDTSRLKTKVMRTKVQKLKAGDKGKFWHRTVKEEIKYPWEKQAIKQAIAMDMGLLE